ncbi:very short patch repair endonuclease [Aeromicrobium sp. JJY06]|uniref:very short patch repair endonuclease n=1 Tax=Aeromicrobium sp. JJY06 TaxID=3373478 RepID=UPI00376EA9FE
MAVLQSCRKPLTKTARRTLTYVCHVARSTPSPTTPGRQSAMRQQKTKDTAPERALRVALRARGLVGYRKHYRALPDLRRTVDVAFVGARVAVDVRGCFWHGCPDHSRRGTANSAWWDEKLARNIERDRDTEQRLSESGWLVLVVWEHEDSDEAAERVSDVVKARRKTHAP